MMIKPTNITTHELIGLQVRVASSTNKNQEGLEGTVVDETRNTFTVETGKGEKTLVKEQCIFEFLVDFRWVQVDGKLLVARPEDRIKKKQQKW